MNFVAASTSILFDSHKYANLINSFEDGHYVDSETLFLWFLPLKLTKFEMKFGVMVK